MSNAPSRRKSSANRSKSNTVTVDGNIRLDLSSMQFTVGESPHTLAECVAAAVRMWSAKYHDRRDGDRSTELPSVVWEVMLNARRYWSPGIIAHFSCMQVRSNTHLKRGTRGGDVYADYSGHQRLVFQDADKDAPYVDHRNPADVAEYRLDVEAFRRVLDADGQIMLDALVAGYGILETCHRHRWNSRRQGKVMNHIKSRHAEFTFPTSRTGEFIKELLKAAYTAA